MLNFKLIVVMYGKKKLKNILVQILMDPPVSTLLLKLVAQCYISNDC